MTEKAAWDAYALLHPRVDSLGQSYTLTGEQAYVSSSLTRAAVGLSPISAPGVVTFAAQDPAIGLTAAAGTPAFGIAFVVPDTGYRLVIQAGPQRSPGVTFENTWAQLAFEDSTSTTPDNLLTDYTVKWGVLIAGRKIFLRSRVVDPNGLDVTGWAYTSALVAA